MSGFIAIHCGAGYHSRMLQPRYKKLCKKGCTAASLILNAGGSALEACMVAIMVLEENPLTNAGYGSNLTLTGDVECDASIMDGETLNYGACGAVKGLKYPVSLATQICRDQLISRPLGLIPPSLLVGEGAQNYAKMKRLIIVDNKSMICRKAYLRHKKHRRLLEERNGEFSLKTEERLDTVGAVCVDSLGHVAAASSSGGIFLKYDGRVGQAATYGCGVWADSFNNSKEHSIAVSTTGTGEYLVKTNLAKEIARNVKDSQCPVTAFHKTLREDFLESKYLHNIPEKLGGALVLYVSPDGDGELIWGHTTKTMGFAYLDTTKPYPTGMISSLPDGMEGRNILVSGASFKVHLS